LSRRLAGVASAPAALNQVAAAVAAAAVAVVVAAVAVAVVVSGSHRHVQLARQGRGGEPEVRQRQDG